MRKSNNGAMVVGDLQTPMEFSKAAVIYIFLCMVAIDHTPVEHTNV